MEILQNKENLVKDISNEYPELIKKINAVRDLELEIKNSLTNILFNITGDTLITPFEMSELDNISDSKVRYHINKYELKKHNGKIYHIFARSSMKVQELYDTIKKHRLN